MSSNVLADRDTNASIAGASEKMDAKVDNKSMEYHRQVLQSKIDQQQYVAFSEPVTQATQVQRLTQRSQNRGKQTYISPSDTIMSPCTAKLSAYRNKQVGKAKPKSLFAKTSTKSLQSGNPSLFGAQIPSNTQEKKFGEQ